MHGVRGAAQRGNVHGQAEVLGSDRAGVKGKGEVAAHSQGQAVCNYWQASPGPSTNQKIQLLSSTGTAFPLTITAPPKAYSVVPNSAEIQDTNHKSGRKKAWLEGRIGNTERREGTCGRDRDSLSLRTSVRCLPWPGWNNKYPPPSSWTSHEATNTFPMIRKKKRPCFRLKPGEQEAKGVVVVPRVAVFAGSPGGIAGLF